MQALSFSVLRWSAWAPGLDSNELWSEWAHGRCDMAAAGQPAVDFIPALLRRRLSNLSRAALWAAYQCSQGDVSLRTVFASPHGEIHRTTELLTDLAAANPLSPNAFSLSVHNTAAGLYSIASGNRAASTAVAAGADTLPAAFIEAAGLIARYKQPVLVVFSDTPLPACYAEWQDQAAVPIALGILLGSPTPASLNLHYSASGSPNTISGAISETTSGTIGVTNSIDKSACLGLLRILGGSAREVVVQGERGNWQWSCDEKF